MSGKGIEFRAVWSTKAVWAGHGWTKLALSLPKSRQRATALYL